MRKLLLVSALCVGAFALVPEHHDAKGDRQRQNVQVVLKTPHTPRFVQIPVTDTGVVRTYVRVNGIDLPMIVDTGAAYLSITETSAASLKGIEYTGMVTLVPAWGNSRKLTKVNLREVRIGGVVLKDVTAVVMPEATDNLLGMSFLNRLAR
jgi:aspartyl protease family protein